MLAALLATIGCIRDVELANTPVLVHCAGDGEICASDGQCCSGTCAVGLCGHSQCLGEGASCQRPEDCCSYQCLQDSSGQLACASGLGCASAGQLCGRAAACCGLACAGAGTCGGTLCAQGGAACAVAGDCCGGRCDAGKCAPPGPECRVAGEICAIGNDCCGGQCGFVAEGVSGCLLQSGCRVAGETCSNATDCCAGLCQVSPKWRGQLQGLPGCKIISERCANGQRLLFRCVRRGRALPGRGRLFPHGRTLPVQRRLLFGNLPLGPRGGSSLRGREGLQGHRGRVQEIHRLLRRRGRVQRRQPLPGASVCRSQGRPCALATDCCSAVCAPSLTGQLACRDSCAPTGGPLHGRLGLLLGRLRRFSRALLAL